MDEYEVESWLFENPGFIGIDHWLARQLKIPGGKVDLLGVDAAGQWVIVEVKAFDAKADGAILQTIRYTPAVEAIRDAVMWEDKRLPIRRVVFAPASKMGMASAQHAAEIGIEVFLFKYDREYRNIVSVEKVQPLLRETEQDKQQFIAAFQSVNHAFYTGELTYGRPAYIPVAQRYIVKLQGEG